MWQTCAMLIALAAAAPDAAMDAARRPAEPALAFECRALHQPEARACAGRCEAAFATAADARFDCVTACTRKAIHATADCRAGLAGRAVLPRPPLASR